MLACSRVCAPLGRFQRVRRHHRPFRSHASCFTCVNHALPTCLRCSACRPRTVSDAGGLGLPVCQDTQVQQSLIEMIERLQARQAARSCLGSRL
jgi:hypothetical protein